MQKDFIKVWVVSMVLLIPGLAWAYGPFNVADDGTMFAWDGTVTYHPEAGSCADFSNAEMRDKITDLLTAWSDVSALSFAEDTEIIDAGTDIDDTNVDDFYVDSADDEGAQEENLDVTPIMFDFDGDIIATLFGSALRLVVLGFAGPAIYDNDTDTIVKGQALFNCTCLPADNDDPDGPRSSSECGLDVDTDVAFSEDDLDFTVIHEIGHMLGFDHTQNNKDSADGDGSLLPTMYPVAMNSAEQKLLNRDDEVVAGALYPDTSFTSSSGTITGELLDSSSNPLRCANVVATNNADSTDVISYVSGHEATLDADSGDCTGDCGVFRIRGCDPGASYTLAVEPIDSAFDGGSSVGPCDPPLDTVEEETIDTSVACPGGGEEDDVGSYETGSTGGVTTEDDDDGDDGAAAATKGGSCQLISSAQAGDEFPLLPLALLLIALAVVRLKKVW